MSLSDCAKCWDTPCSCGWGYRNLSKESREDLAASVLGISLGDLQTAIITPVRHPLQENERWSNSHKSELSAVAPARPDVVGALCRRLAELVETVDDAANLLSGITKDEVNAQDEAEKWLRAYAPEYLR